LPDEKEDEEGFQRCLELNSGAACRELESRYGAFREICLVARAERGGPVLGGANFLAAPVGAHVSKRPLTTANLNYIFVSSTARGRGYLRALVSGVAELIPQLFERDEAAELPEQVFLFIEQNDPFRMTPEQYEEDTKVAGVAQLVRLKMWARLGARVVDFPYGQPALSADQDADPTLIYSVLGSDASELEAPILEAHLRSFFGISVLKGAPLDAEPHARRQLAELSRASARGARIGLLEPTPVFRRLESEALDSFRKRAESFRAAIHCADA
jgi:hypothetical protein